MRKKIEEGVVDPNNEEADFAFAFGPSTLANKVGLGEERSFT